MPPESGSPKKKGEIKYTCIIFLNFDREFVIPEPKENNNSEEKIKKKKKKKKQRQVSYYNI